MKFLGYKARILKKPIWSSGGNRTSGLENIESDLNNLLKKISKEQGEILSVN